MAQYDVIIIGGGPGGYNAAIRAGFLGSNMTMLAKPFSLDTLAKRISQLIATS